MVGQKYFEKYTKYNKINYNSVNFRWTRWPHLVAGLARWMKAL